MVLGSSGRKLNGYGDYSDCPGAAASYIVVALVAHNKNGSGRNSQPQ